MASTIAFIQEAKHRFDRLRDDCSRVRDRVDAHVQRQIDQLHSTNTQHKQHLDKDERYIRQLSSELRSWKASAEELHQQIEREQTSEERLSEAIRQVKQIEAELPKKLSQLNEEHRRLEMTLQQKRESLASMREECQRQMSNEGQTAALTAKYFGMKLEPQNDRGLLRVVLTQIDRERPFRPFAFTLRIEQQQVQPQSDGSIQTRGQYVIDECDPQISFEPLLEDLNRSNDLQQFVVRMRQLFDQHANHTSPS